MERTTSEAHVPGSEISNPNNNSLLCQKGLCEVIRGCSKYSCTYGHNCHHNNDYLVARRFHCLQPHHGHLLNNTNNHDDGCAHPIHDRRRHPIENGGYIFGFLDPMTLFTLGVANVIWGPRENRRAGSLTEALTLGRKLALLKVDPSCLYRYRISIQFWSGF
jgi:hypothetical protein